MMLVKKLSALKRETKSDKIYINTLTPYFQFKNKFGRVIMPNNCCITL